MVIAGKVMWVKLVVCTECGGDFASHHKIRVSPGSCGTLVGLAPTLYRITTILAEATFNWKPVNLLGPQSLSYFCPEYLIDDTRNSLRSTGDNGRIAFAQSADLLHSSRVSTAKRLGNRQTRGICELCKFVQKILWDIFGWVLRGQGISRWLQRPAVFYRRIKVTINTLYIW